MSTTITTTTRTRAPKHGRRPHRSRIAVLVAALLTAVGTGLVAAPFVTAAAAPAGPPTAPAKVGVCHATTSDTHPYNWLVVSINSTRYQGHLMHRTDPPHAWKSDGAWNGIEHRAGDGKPDYIQGLDAGLTRDWCLGLVTPTPTPTTTTPTPTDTGTSTSTPTDTPTTTPPVDTGSPTPSTSSPAATTTAPEPGTTAPAPSTSKPGELAHTAGSSTSMLLVLSGLVLVGLGALTMLATRRVGVHA